MKLVLLFFVSSIFVINNLAQTIYNYDVTDWQIVAEGCEFPEGPAYDGKGNLYFSNCYGSWIGKYDGIDTKKFLSKNDSSFTISKTNGLTFGKDGFIYACDYGIGAILKISPEGSSEILIDGYDNVKFNRPNDLAFSPSGKLFFTDPKSYDKNNLDGRIFKHDFKSNKTELISEGLGFPNGIAFSPDGKYLFVCESALQRVLKYEINVDEKLSSPKVIIDLPGGDPDGIAFDVSGNLWVAHFGGKAVYVVTQSGELISKIETPGMKPSNLEFGGLDMKTLFLTETETNKVYQLKVEVHGLKLF